MTKKDEKVEQQRAAAKEQRLTQAKREVDGVVSRLSPNERTFLIHFLAGETRTEAASLAGYKSPDKQGSRLANSPKIKAAIDEVLTAQHMGKLEVIARLSEQARAAYSPYLLPSGKVDLDRLIGDDKGHLIKGFKPGRYGLSVEFHDAQTALVNMGRVHGIFTDNVNSSGEIGVNVQKSAMDKLTRLTKILDKAKGRRDATAPERSES